METSEVIRTPEEQKLIDKINRQTESTATNQRELYGNKTDATQESPQLAGEKENFAKEIQESIGDVSPEDVKELTDATAEIVKESSPETAEYIQKVSPELDSLIRQVSTLRDGGEVSKAIDLVSVFLEKQEVNVDMLRDEKSRDSIKAYLAAALDVAGLQEKMSSQMKMELVSAGVDLVPIIGSLKMMGEASYGKDMAGNKLDGWKRGFHFVEGVGFLALDVVGIAGSMVSAGGATVAAQGVKVTAKGAKAAEVGLKAGKTITRFAALIRKTTKMNGVARKVFKFGKIIRKYPMLSGMLIKSLQAKQKAKRVESLYRTGKILDAVKKPEANSQKITNTTKITRESALQVIDQ